VRRQGVTVERGSSSFLQVFAFYAPDGRYDDLYTSNYVTLNVLDRLKRIPGTTNVQIFGAHDYAMRIWLKPDRMAQLKLTPDRRDPGGQRAERAVRGGQGGPVAGGAEAGPGLHDRDARDGSPIPRSSSRSSCARTRTGRSCGSATSRASELGSKDYEFVGRYNGHPATLVGIFLAPGANALDVAKPCKAEVADMAQRFPPGFTYAVPYDTTRFVEVSIREVLYTLGEAMLPGVPRRVPVPAEPGARRSSVRGRAGIADRHVRRDLLPRLLDQHADAVRHGAVDRHRGRTTRSSCSRTSSASCARKGVRRARPRSRPCAR
jgi:hypothetical protein